MQPLDDDDKASIETTIDDEVLRGRRSRSARPRWGAPGGDRLRVHGELTLAGATAPVAFDLVVRDDSALTGSVVVRQTDWGISPYSALFGALKVSDEVEVAIDVDLLARVSAPMPGYELIRPLELKPALLALDGISRVSVEAHYELSTGATWRSGTRSSARLGAADPGSARNLKVELSFAVGGIKSHEVYFEHLGGAGGDPRGVRRPDRARLRLGRAWRPT